MKLITFFILILLVAGLSVIVGFRLGVFGEENLPKKDVDGQEFCVDSN